MKVETICKTQVSFPPITLTITIENEEELIALYHRFNVADKITFAQDSQVRKPMGNASMSHVVWVKLNELIIRRGLKRS